MTEGQLVIDICAEFNSDPPQVVVRNAFDPVEVEIAVFDGGLTVSDRLEKYRSQMNPQTFRELGEMLREKMKQSILGRVKEMQDAARG